MAKLSHYTELKPSVTYSIKNYHFELKEIKEKKIIKADKEARELREKYEKKVERIKEKREQLLKEKKEELEYRESRGIISRVFNVEHKDIGQIDSEIE